MQSTRTYAKLSCEPRMFCGKDQVVFTIEYSQDLIFTTGKLEVYGYAVDFGTGHTYTDNLSEDKTSEQFREYEYHGIGIEYPMNAYSQVGNSLINHFYIDAGVLFPNSNITPTTWITGSLPQATVTFFDNNGKKVFESNTITLNMYCPNTEDIIILNVGHKAGNNQNVTLHKNYVPTFGSPIATDINSYQIFVYDTDDNLISQSEVMYDWINGDMTYNITNLENQTRYKVKAVVDLIGGLSVTTNTSYATVAYPTYVYADTSVLSFTNTQGVALGLLNIPSELSSTNNIMICRSELNKDTWVLLDHINISSDTIEFQDRTLLTGTDYVYRIECYNGNDFVGVIYQQHKMQLDGFTISDILENHYTNAETEYLNYNKNDGRVTTISCLDSKYPYAITNSIADYYNGSVTTLFVKQDTDYPCSYQWDDVSEYSKHIADWLNNGMPKLIRFDNGFNVIASITGGITVSSSENIAEFAKVSFNWTEIADAHDEQELKRLGFIKGVVDE